MKESIESNSFPLPPGKLGVPVLGEGLELLFNPKDFAEKRFKKYGSIFKTNLFGSNTIYVRGGNAIKFVLANENKYFINNLPPSTKALIGPHSLSNQTGEEHLRRRRQIYQAFSQRALANYGSETDKITQKYLMKWQENYSFQWYPELRKYTLEVACKFLIGVDDISNTKIGHLFETWSKGLFSFTPPLPGTTLNRALNSRKKILEELDKIIEQRITANNIGNDALSILLSSRNENDEKLDKEEIKDQILTLLFAGHETLTSALSTLCLNLALYPNVMNQCREEQKGLGYPNQLDQTTLSKMKYLEKVMKETLRINSPVGGGFKKIIKNCNFNGYEFPKGWNVFYLISATHLNPNCYLHPEEFDPDRWTEGRSEDQCIELNYAPFGSGVRECIGKEFAKQEMKIFATRLLQGYRWTLSPSQNLDMHLFPVPYPKDKLKIKFSKI